MFVMLIILFLCLLVWALFQVYRTFLLENEYQSSKLCEAKYTECEDKMDHLQVMRLPSMAKFNAGFLQCNETFERQCVGPSKELYKQKMMKVRLHAFSISFLLFCVNSIEAWAKYWMWLDCVRERKCHALLLAWDKSSWHPT